MLIRVDPLQPDGDVIRQAAEVIRRGGLVAFPTETVYGLGADALNPEAVERIFAAKRRPFYDPIIVHLARFEDLQLVARVVASEVSILSTLCWPGPLTLILPRAPALSARVTAGLDTVAVRIPDHPVALALIRAAQTPIAAPSANLFGHVSPTTARHVLDDLGDRVDMILDGGQTRIGVESTVLSLSGQRPTILRPGGISREVLSAVLGDITVGADAWCPDSEEIGFHSPGLMERHYSPRAEVTLFRGAEQETLNTILECALKYVAAGKRVGLLVASEDISVFASCPVLVQDLGSRHNLDHIASRLFAALRALDEQGVEVILARGFGTAGLGLAIEDRLTKAAGGRVVEV